MRDAVHEAGCQRRLLFAVWPSPDLHYEQNGDAERPKRRQTGDQSKAVPWAPGHVVRSPDRLPMPSVPCTAGPLRSSKERQLRGCRVAGGSPCPCGRGPRSPGGPGTTEWRAPTGLRVRQPLKETERPPARHSTDAHAAAQTTAAGMEQVADAASRSGGRRDQNRPSVLLKAPGGARPNQREWLRGSVDPLPKLRHPH